MTHVSELWSAKQLCHVVTLLGINKETSSLCINDRCMVVVIVMCLFEGILP